jgi:bifunctional ADP-heptose synthase (sugar kinase/adenylyltransferase)
VVRNIKAFGVNCDIISDENTLLKTRYVDEKTNHMLFRLDSGSDILKKFDINEINFLKYDAIILSLDGRGEPGRAYSFLNESDVKNICEKHDNVFLDSKSKIIEPIPENLKFLKINHKELDLNDYLKPYVFDKEENEIKKRVIVTYGKDGCLYNGKMYPSPDPQVSRDLSGAGDTFLSALSVALIKDKKNIDDAIHYANTCAGIVVTKKGVATV